MHNYFFIFIGWFVLVIVIIYAIRRFTTIKDKTKEQRIAILRSVDLKKTKEAAYTITKYGRLVVKDEEEVVFQSLEKLLREYKYKKEVESFSSETLNRYQLFLEMIDA